MDTSPGETLALQQADSNQPAAEIRSVCVMGLGYVGLPTAGILANCGYHVFGVDIRPEVVETINRGAIHIYEPALEGLVSRVVEQGHLRASLEPQAADVFFISVPTPIRSDHSPDLSYVSSASRAIRPLVRPGNLIILESTSPPKTTETVVADQAVPDDLTVGEDVFVAYCPERVLPGRILVEAVQNDRIVGGVTPKCTARARQFYETFVEGRVLGTDAITAEIVKLSENAYRDVNIALANELSMLAAGLDADPFEIIRLANHHPRVSILEPGPGVGGHCISVDPWFLVHSAPEASELIRAARQVNDHKPWFVVEQIEQVVREHDVRCIGCLGLTYKADVDDLRGSPSLEIVQELRRRNVAEVLACDPLVRPGAEALEGLSLTELDEVLERGELLVLLTDHAEFRQLPRAALDARRLYDTRGAWHAEVPRGAASPRGAAIRESTAPATRRAA